jgi:hypothetical protein
MTKSKNLANPKGALVEISLPAPFFFQRSPMNKYQEKKDMMQTGEGFKALQAEKAAAAQEQVEETKTEEAVEVDARVEVPVTEEDDTVIQ